MISVHKEQHLGTSLSNGSKRRKEEKKIVEINNNQKYCPMMEKLPVRLLSMKSLCSVFWSNEFSRFDL